MPRTEDEAEISRSVAPPSDSDSRADSVQPRRDATDTAVYVRRVVALAPPLSVQQRMTLAGLLARTYDADHD